MRFSPDFGVLARREIIYEEKHHTNFMARVLLQLLPV